MGRTVDHYKAYDDEASHCIDSRQVEPHLKDQLSWLVTGVSLWNDIANYLRVGPSLQG